MKKNIYKIVAATLALTIMAVSPSTALTAHAYGFNPDGPGDNAGLGTDNVDDNYWSNQSWVEPEAPAYEEPAYEAPSNEASDNNESDSREPSYEASDEKESYSSEPSDEAPANNTASNSSATGTASVSKNTANDVTVNVTGGQKFRITTDANHLSYQVYHCGISRTTFIVVDAKENTVPFCGVTLERGTDGLWYVVINFPEGTETKDYTVVATKGDATYLGSKLGVSGIKIGGEIVLSTVPATDEN